LETISLAIFMTLQEYKRLNKMLNSLEDTAIKEGVDITSPEFQSLTEELIGRKGYTMEEYNEHNEPMVEDKEIEIKIT